MDLRHLRYLIAAVEEGSLQGAAQRMNVAQPALSRRIRDLEASLGCDLLTRGARGVTPTRAGAAFYRDALSMLEDLDQARHRARRLGREAADVPRLGLVVTARKLPFLHQTVAGYQAQFPGSPISFQRNLSPDLAHALRERRLDMSLLYEWRLGSPGINERHIHSEQYVLAMHPNHPLAGTRPIRLAELSGEPLVWLSRGEMTLQNDPLMQQCHLRGLEPTISHIARTHDEHIDLTMVSAGACITPASVLLDIHRDFMAIRPLAEREMEMALSLAWWADLAGGPAVELLRQLHAAIDVHQHEIASGKAAWASIAGHQVIRIPELSNSGEDRVE